METIYNIIYQSKLAEFIKMWEILFGKDIV